MKVLTVRQPFAWLIVHGVKTVENRSRRTSHRGPLLIQAAAQPAGDYDDAVARARAMGIAVPDGLRYGGIVGSVVLVDCVRSHPSPWATGPWCWTLESPQTLPFVPMRGQLSLFDAPERALEALRPALNQIFGS